MSKSKKKSKKKTKVAAKNEPTAEEMRETMYEMLRGQVSNKLEQGVRLGHDAKLDPYPLDDQLERVRILDKPVADHVAKQILSNIDSDGKVMYTDEDIRKAAAPFLDPVYMEQKSANVLLSGKIVPAKEYTENAMNRMFPKVIEDRVRLSFKKRKPVVKTEKPAAPSKPEDVVDLNQLIKERNAKHKTAKPTDDVIYIDVCGSDSQRTGNANESDSLFHVDFDRNKHTPKSEYDKQLDKILVNEPVSSFIMKELESPFDKNLESEINNCSNSEAGFHIDCERLEQDLLKANKAKPKPKPKKRAKAAKKIAKKATKKASKKRRK